MLLNLCHSFILALCILIYHGQVSYNSYMSSQVFAESNAVAKIAFVSTFEWTSLFFKILRQISSDSNLETAPSSESKDPRCRIDARTVSFSGVRTIKKCKTHKLSRNSMYFSASLAFAQVGSAMAN